MDAGTAEVCAPQLSFRQMRAAQVCTGQLSVPKVDSAQEGPFQVDPVQVCALEIGMAQVCAYSVAVSTEPLHVKVEDLGELFLRELLVGVAHGPHLILSVCESQGE
jgi:hypothetical protein